MKKVLWTLILTTILLLISCAPITQLQSPRIGRGFSLEGNAALIGYRNDQGTRDTIIKYVTGYGNNLEKDTVDTNVYTDRSG